METVRQMTSAHEIWQTGQAAKVVQREQLLVNLRAAHKDLSELHARVTNHWAYEDPIYRFYHQSFKVFALQEETETIVSSLRALAPEGCELHEWFLLIVAEGTGAEFDISYNEDWLVHARPILEANGHARFFLDMAVKYGGESDETPGQMLPSGWAALLYLYGLR